MHTDSDNQTAQRSRPHLTWAACWPTLLLALGLVIWWLVYRHLVQFAVWYTYDVLLFPRVPGTEGDPVAACCGSPELPNAQMSAAMRQGRAAVFLLFQLPNVFLLLALVVFVMGVVRSYFSPERTRALLAGRRGALGYVLASLLGVATPFCSCSAVPLFIGFITAGVPLGYTLTFLAAAPLVNEVALAILFQQFGWRVAGLYMLAGLALSLTAGWLLGRARLERYVEGWVYEIIAGTSADEERSDWTDRLRTGLTAVREIIGRVWPYVLAGVVTGAVIHAYVSREALAALLGGRHWWSVPLAVAVGVPIYANAWGILPVVQALQAKGVPIGTVLAFMMAVVGLSLPEFIILRRVLKLPLILLFIGTLAIGILIIGLVFNILRM